MSGFELVTLIIAIWGAALSTILGGYEVYANRRQVKVKVKAGMIHETQGTASWTTYTLQINFYNKSKRPITIISYGFELPNKKHIPIFQLEHPVNLPHSFFDGEGCDFIGNGERITRIIKESGSQEIFKSEDTYKIFQIENILVKK